MTTDEIDGRVGSRTSTITRIGLVLAGVLAVVDLAGGLSQLALGSIIPLAVSVGSLVLGAATLVAIPAGWRGRTWAIRLIIVSRAVAALTAVPAFFVPDVPLEGVSAAAISVLVTVAAIALLLAGRTR